MVKVMQSWSFYKDTGGWDMTPVTELELLQSEDLQALWGWPQSRDTL